MLNLQNLKNDLNPQNFHVFYNQNCCDLKPDIVHAIIWSFDVIFFKVPVDKDLQEIIKEISIMQQCDSPYVVKYYGSYFKNTDLWVSLIESHL